jgi:ABC-type multidrug transport system fused ATPase/permease subunit
MTLKQKINRFFLPYFAYTPKERILNFFVYFSRCMFPISGIILMKYTLLALQNGLSDEYRVFIIGYVGVFVFFTLILYVTRFYDWSVSDYRINGYLYEKYFKKMLRLDHRYVEKIGTGKLTHIITSGIEAWRGALFDISYYLVSLSVTIVFMIWMTVSINGFLPVGFLLGFIVMSV